ncbi:MAG TPA: YbhB/YbcL family Raf kinase inhibitor-like protein [Methanosarcina barkeri]|uniref:YbhB/YbcL family Raf kinase inhibitor-like protein n=1 Tax=Methanosarcina baikalica TaxID=3073890 RepID=A0ABU2D366_9EURY|nr:YbhB/YbcL family Raf kinase inhibitor-like protein [Methanosarcina sp. Z-7115]MDR7666423.1 YbhB/YbcL family Raf kinase inhibitor-like protein [Methanosarcina sp. Z-7115]HWQ45076.1 YbhB/YbcL family Raf kinase inhibitor-like protein [Methanosarcina barkeri]
MNKKAGTIVLIFLLAGMLLISGCIQNNNERNTTKESPDTGKGDENVNIQNIKVFSSAFEANRTIPRKYTCDGKNLNPPLELEGIPEEAESLVLIIDDPDAPMKIFTHWIVWNIEPVAKIEEDSIPGVEGINDFRKIGYGGPCPSSGTHRYFFRVYALDRKLELKAGAGRKELESEMIGHIIAEGELIGKYSRT